MIDLWTKVPSYDTPIATVGSALRDLRAALTCLLMGHDHERYYLFDKVHKSCDRCNKQWEALMRDLSTETLESLLEEQCDHWFGTSYKGFCDRRRSDAFSSDPQLIQMDVVPIEEIERFLAERRREGHGGH